MENSTYFVKTGTIITDGFQVGTRLRQGDGLAPILFNTAPVYVIRQLSVQTTSIIFHKTVQSIGYADDINIMSRKKRATSDVYGETERERTRSWAYHKC